MAWGQSNYSFMVAQDEDLAAVEVWTLDLMRHIAAH